MRGSLLGSGALHVLALATLLALSLSQRVNLPRGSGGEGAFALLPVTLVGGTDAPAAGTGVVAGVNAAESAPRAAPASVADRVLDAPAPEPAVPLSGPAAPDVPPPSGAELGEAASTLSTTAGGESEPLDGARAGGPPGAGTGAGNRPGDGFGPEGLAGGASSASAGAGEASVTPPVPLHLSVPVVPAGFDSREARGARVRLLVEVSESGEVTGVSLLQGSGFESIDEAAIEAVRKVRYRPATEAGVPVASVAGAEVGF